MIFQNIVAQITEKQQQILVDELNKLRRGAGAANMKKLVSSLHSSKLLFVLYIYNYICVKIIVSVVHS